MFVLRPSSPLKTLTPQPATEPEIEAEGIQSVASSEPYIDVGLPVPDSYEVDIIRALLQDPFHIFIYWKVRPAALAALTRFFSPEEALTFGVVLKLRDMEGRQEAFFNVSDEGRYWMTVFPDREYEFEIGVRSPEHGYIALIRSNRVRTPRGTVSPLPPQDEEYKMSPPEFIEVVEASGFGAQQTLDLTIAAMPGAEEAPDAWAQVLNRLPRPVREAIAEAAGGKPLTADMVEQFPNPLRVELRRLLEMSDGRVAALGLMHYLPELLREELGDEHEWIGDHIHPLHLTQRFFLGGTESITWPGGLVRLPVAPRRSSSDTLGRGPSSHTTVRPPVNES